MLWAKATSGKGSTPRVSWWRRIPTAWSTRSVNGMPWFELVPTVNAFEALCYWQPFRSVGFPSSRTSTHAVNRFKLATIFSQWPNRCQLHRNCKIHLLMYSTIKVRNGIQATPQGRRHLRAGVGFELAIKRQPARRLVIRHNTKRRKCTTLCMATNGSVTYMNVHAWRPISQSEWQTTKISEGCLWN
jgi:hypothetical protein